MKLLGHHVHPAFLLLAIAEFAVSALAFVVASLASRYWHSANEGLNALNDLTWAAGFGIAVAVGMLAMGLYHPRQRLRIEGIVAREFVAMFVAVFLLLCVDVVFEVDIPAMTWAGATALSILLIAFVRLGFERVIDQEAFRRRVLVLGAGERASSLLKLRRKSDQRGFRLVAFIPAKGDRHVIDDPRVAEGVASLPDYAREQSISEIVVAMDDRRQSFPVVDLLECRFAGIEIINIVEFLERETGRVKIDLVTPDWMIYSGGFTSSTFRDFVLRALDLAVVIVTAPISVPLMAIVAIMILATDGRPVFYRQERVGLRGVPFVVLKFRSMIKDAESDGGARWATAQDSRVTSIGSVLRKYRLDELPQLVNVAKGEMSVVGPRPERPEFVKGLVEEIPYYNERHCVKPGITGWAQMSYPYGSSQEDAREKLAFDLYYVKYRSLIFNIAVMLQTAEVVLWRKGAR